MNILLILMTLFEFLNQQSNGRLVGYAILLIIILAIVFEGIVEIVKHLKKK